LKTQFSVFLATIIGIILFGLSIIALIRGAVACSLYPRYSLDRIASSESPLPVLNYSEASCGSWNPVTFGDPHTLCSKSISTWSLLQLAALPILGEAWAITPPNPDLVRSPACLAEVSLMSDDREVSFQSRSVLVYN
jgi:hypothetical protein